MEIKELLFIYAVSFNIQRQLMDSDIAYVH